MNTNVRRALLSALADFLCVVAFVVIGTRNHDTDTSSADVVSVAAPFVVALAIAYVTNIISRTAWTIKSGIYVWIVTVTVGMVERSLLFDKGTALTFILVTAGFLFATMIGWRGAYNKYLERSSAKA